MPIIKTLKNGQWTPVNSVTSLGTATTTTAGLMSASDKEKLDNVTEYSTTEQVIGTWIDGKPIYRKCLNTGTLPNNNTMSVNHGISDFAFATNIYGYVIDTSDNTRIPLPYPATTATSSIGIWVSDTAVRINTGKDRTNCSGVIVLEYTKTTD